MQDKPFHSLSIEDTYRKLNTSINGLSVTEVKKRQKEFGKNVLEETKTSKIRIFFRQFKNILIYILFAASLVSLFLGAWTDFFIINALILINGLIAFIQELKAESSIAALRKLTESRNEVKREGQFQSIPSSELVPGDYVILYEGEAITADMRLIETQGLHIDESSLTGESIPIVKNPQAIFPENTMPFDLTNMLLTGTTVVRGSGHAIVVKTGANTYLASVAEKAQESSPDSPLTKALKIFSRRYLFLLIAVFTLIGILGALQGRTLLDLGYILLAGLVSAVPEGLPIVITLVMIIGALALSKKQALIRYLPAVETLGSVTVIASDKTGTITQGKLIVKEASANDWDMLRRIAVLCNDATLDSGDPLDKALLQWVAERDQIRSNAPRSWFYPFDSHMMLMATANTIDQQEYLLVKGAYETLRAKADNPEEFDEPFQKYLNQGLRVIGFASGSWIQDQNPASWKVHLVGLVGFLDPPKAEIPEAVAAAKRAGIRILMITGDHPQTAKEVAREVGIWKQHDTILVGKEIETMSEEALLHALSKTTVLARILPEHKYRIIKTLQKSKELVAVTGDGVNDVPALRAADIGIAMGGGTEAAKSASSMIITDNNLKVILDAIRNARVIADNIRKVIYYLVSTSFQEVVLIFLAIVSSLPPPMFAIQILWINLVTDGVLDKTFAFNKEEGNVLDRAPRRPETQFLNLSQILRILFFGIIMGVLCFLIYLVILPEYNKEEASSIIFTSVVVAQWANGIQSQKENEPFFCNIRKSFSTNPWIYLGVCLGLLLQCVALYLIPNLFHAVPLTFSQWKYPALAFLGAFFLVEIRKWFERKRCIK